LRQRRPLTCIALAAAFLLVLAAPGLALDLGDTTSDLEKTTKDLTDTVEETVGGPEDEVKDAEDAVKETTKKTTKKVEDTVTGGTDAPAENNEEQPREREADSTDRERRSSSSDATEVAAAAVQSITRATPASVLSLFRMDDSTSLTSLIGFRIPSPMVADAASAPGPNLDDVLEPVVRDAEPMTAGGGETPILAAPAQEQALTPIERELPWYSALGAVALILLLTSSALLSEVRPGRSSQD
jgi:hypothetical protein